MGGSRRAAAWAPAGRRLLLALGLAAAVAPWWAGRAAAATVEVRNAAEFNRAAAADRAAGGRILLLAHDYRNPLVVGTRSGGWLAIQGLPGARVRDLELLGSRDVAITHVAVRPLGADGGVLVSRATTVVLTHDSFSAAGTPDFVGLNLDHSSHVTVRASEFSHCGDRFPAPALCLRPVWARFVTIEHDRFHDCVGCDFIHGRAGRHLVIQHNRFARALACQAGPIKCRHQDLIELFAARGLFVRDNRFGVSQLGGAQLYMSGPVDFVRVVNNLFIRNDPRAPGVVPPEGVLIGARGARRLPHQVWVVNNTILSGKPANAHHATSIQISPGYRRALGRNRPLVANNVLGRLVAVRLACGLARISTRNVIARGTACSASDRVGDPHLDAHAQPTAASVLLLDRAVPAFAPAHDMLGRPRGAKPDIGAFEFPG